MVVPAEAEAEAGNINLILAYIILGGNMSKKEEFKVFVKEHPELIRYIKSGEMTWQKFFEIYSIYGKDDSVWNKYFKNEEEKVEKKETVGITELIDMVKKVDLESVQKNITNISKAIGLVQSLITGDEVQNETYTPRPLYKKFED